MSRSVEIKGVAMEPDPVRFSLRSAAGYIPPLLHTDNGYDRHTDHDTKLDIIIHNINPDSIRDRKDRADNQRNPSSLKITRKISLKRISPDRKSADHQCGALRAAVSARSHQHRNQRNQNRHG